MANRRVEINSRLGTTISKVGHALTYGADVKDISTLVSEINGIASKLKKDDPEIFPYIKLENLSLQSLEKGLTTEFRNGHFDVFFENCEFQSQVYFKYSSRLFSFKNCKNVHVKFDDYSHENLEVKSIIIDSCEGKTSLWVEENCKLNSLNLSGLTELYLNINKVTILRQLNLSDSKVTSWDGESLDMKGYMNVTGNEFKYAPRLFGATIHPSVEFEKNTYLEKTPEQAHVFRYLKAEMSRIHNVRAETLFASYELESRHRAMAQLKSKNFWDYLDYFVSSIYKASNRWGREPFRPLKGLVLTFLIFSFTYMTFFSVEVDPNNEFVKELWQSEVNLMTNEHRAVVLSFVNSLGPLKLIQSLNLFTLDKAAYAIVPLVQTIISSYLLFLLLLGIRRRYRSN